MTYIDNLVDRARRGDEPAFRALVERMRGNLWGLARSYFAPGIEVDDLFQEGLIGVHTAVRDFDPMKGQSFEVFAYFCAKREVISAVRAATRRRHEPLNGSAPITGNDLAPRPIALARHVEARIHLALISELAKHRLSGWERQSLALSIGGWTMVEIAVRHRRDPKSVENAIRRARAKLICALEDVGWPPSFPTIDEDRSRVTRMDLKRGAIAAALDESDEPLTKQGIARLIDSPVQGLHNLLLRMNRRGECIRTRDDRWVAPRPSWPSQAHRTVGKDGT